MCVCVVCVCVCKKVLQRMKTILWDAVIAERICTAQCPLHSLTRARTHKHTITAHTQEVDRRERVNLCLSLHDLRNNYFILWDSITKNLEKIKKPRSAVEMPFT